MSRVLSYDPLVTPRGNPENVGVVVATPAVPVPATAVAAWMWDAVVVPSRPENTTCTRMVWATVSMVTRASPTPGEALAGDSFGPVRWAEYTIMPAGVGRARPSTAAATANQLKRIIANLPSEWGRPAGPVSAMKNGAP